jgi:hypothetical protein
VFGANQCDVPHRRTRLGPLCSDSQPLFPDIFVSLAKWFRRGRQLFRGAEGDALAPVCRRPMGAGSRTTPIQTLAGEGGTFLANCERAMGPSVRKCPTRDETQPRPTAGNACSITPAIAQTAGNRKPGRWDRRQIWSRPAFLSRRRGQGSLLAMMVWLRLMA